MNDKMGVSPGLSDDEAREKYANGVEDYFLRRRRSSMLLTAKDRFRVLQWFEEGIPLPIVLAAISEVFDRSFATGEIEPIFSIGYCRHAVRRRFSEHERALVGSDGGVKKRRKRKASPEDDGGTLAERLSMAAARLEDSAAPVAGRLRALLPEIGRIERDDESPLSDREGLLIDLERRFVSELLPELTPEERDAVDVEAEIPLAKITGSVSPEERQRLREIGRLRAVRRRYALPRLTLLPR